MLFRRRKSGTMRRGTAAVLAALCAAVVPAAADFTPVLPPTASGELSLLEIFAQVYSPDVAWQPLGLRVDSNNRPIDYTNGTLVATRVDDFGLGGPLNVQTESAGQTNDQLWTGGPLQANARARYAAYAQEFGYDVSGDHHGYIELFHVTGNGMHVGGSATLNLAPGTVWSWARSGANLTWYSDMGQNCDEGDHLATYEVTGLQDGLKHWTLFWEDLRQLGDRDYNDLVVEVTAARVPEPGTLLLAAVGLASVAPRRALRAGA
jgi:hypothetical protein